MNRPLPGSLETVTVAAPIGGLNTISAGAAMPPQDCVSLFNMLAAEYGLRSRLGSREWCTGLSGVSDSNVRSILPFTGSREALNRLFATTSSGIWDVSASTASPTLVLAFANTSGRAGWGNCSVYVTAAGHFLVYTDEVNGMHVYTESTGTWAKTTMGGGPGQINGVDPNTLVYVTAWKGRLWFVQRDTSKAWFTDVAVLFGTLNGQAIDFAGRFRTGGYLVGLWNWSYDGGSGMDDSLVAISSGGDVAVYQGTDPSSAATFGLKGVWFMGTPPAGRRIATDFGGDVLLLSRAGIRELSQLVLGRQQETPQYATAKIANLFNAAMQTKATIWGWSMRIHPEDASLIVTVPTSEGFNTEQLAMSLTNRSWSRYRDLPLFSCESWQGKFWMGTQDGRVLVNDGYVDGRTLADPDAFTPVQWALLTSFQNLGNGRHKQVVVIRPSLLSEAGLVPFSVDARYRYNFGEVGPVSSSLAGGSLWDIGLWDTAVWGGEYAPTQKVRGAKGMGPEVAIAIRGQAVSRTSLVGFDLAFRQGGFL